MRKMTKIVNNRNERDKKIKNFFIKKIIIKNSFVNLHFMQNYVKYFSYPLTFSLKTHQMNFALGKGELEVEIKIISLIKLSTCSRFILIIGEHLCFILS